MQKARWMANDALFLTGWKKAHQILGSSGQRILVYHGLDQKGEKALNGRFISADTFAAQVRFLKDHAQIVTLNDYFSGQFADQPFTVALTFDDGYRNNIQYGLPVLEQYGVPATFFLTGAASRGAQWLWMDFLDVATRLGPPAITIHDHLFVKKKKRHTLYYADAQGRTLGDWARKTPWSFIQAMEAAFLQNGAWNQADTLSTYWALLSTAEIAQLASSPLVTIGAHGFTHQDLALLPLADACRELEACKLFLEKTIRKPVRALAYPFGSYTRALVDSAEKMGFDQQLAVDYLYPEDHHDPRLRDRMGINPFISPTNQWLAIKNGAY